MNPLESRKRLLIAESELNRAQMAADLDDLVAETRALTGKVKTFGSLARSAGSLVAGLAGFKRSPVDPAPKLSWMQTILKGAGVVSTLWTAFRNARIDEKNK